MNAFADGVSMPLLTLALKASALLGLTALTMLLIGRRASAATRHWAWSMAVASLLALPVLSLSLPAWSVAVPVAAPVTPPATSNDPLPVAADYSSVQAAAESTAAGLATTASASEPRRAGLSWSALALMVYAAGLAAMVARLVVQQVAASRLAGRAIEVRDRDWMALLTECAAHLGISRPVRLLRSRERSMPMAIGVRKGAILIPSIADTWTTERRRAVLLHELAHVGRRDCLTQLLAETACAVYWPHPAVWWVARRLRVERELACDDRVLRAGTEARDYAGHLLEIAYDLGGFRAPSLAVSMARPGQLEGRMLAVLDAARNRAIPGKRARLAGTVAAAATLLPLSVLALRAEPLSAEIDDLSVLEAPARVAEPLARPAPAHIRHVEPHAAPPAAGQTQSPSRQSGAWTVRPSDKQPGTVHLEMREDRSSTGHSVPLSSLEGLTASQMGGDSTPVRFSIRRDAGTFNFEGTFRNGVGGGVFGFQANPAFGGDLEKRGVGKPTADQQYDMARHDVGLALLDELNTQGYPKPSLETLIQAGHHGVRVEFVREMGQLGYKVGSVEALIKMRDHGVSPSFVRELAAAGYTKLSAEELVRARDHGVSTEFVKQMRDLGYGTLTMDQLVNARDHGVSGEFAREMAAAGYKLSLEQMIKARDHGVGTDFVKEMAALGYSKLSLDELVNARDHGVSASFAKEMAAAGYAKLPLNELINARDHGVSSAFAREMRELGYQATLADLVRARDHGVSSSFVRELKALGYDNIPLDQVINLRDHGVSAEKIKRANEKAGTKLPLEMVRSMVDGGGLR
jgi:beta-lactamase regulating signal transducer with metallopeptidase domain